MVCGSERVGLVLHKLFSPKSIHVQVAQSDQNQKSYGESDVATGACGGCCRKPLVTDLHIGGPGVRVVLSTKRDGVT